VQNLSKDDTIPYPEWYPIKRCLDDEYDAETGAAVLCSFQIIDPEKRKYAVPAEKITLNRPLNLSNGALYPMP